MQNNKFFSLPVENITVMNDNPDFLFVKLQTICEGQNLNNTVFLLDGMEKCKDSFKSKPLMCAFPHDFINNNYKIGDGHNTSGLMYDEDEDTYYYSYLDGSDERCVGYILPDSDINIEDINGSKWITMTALIFKKYNYELVKDILKNKENLNNVPSGQKRISVEIEVTNAYEQNELEYLVSWIGDGVTILNDDVKEGIAGANLQTYAKSDNFKKYTEVLNFTYNKYKNSNEDITNFPKQGDNEKISLTNSKYKIFDIDYAKELKNNYPTIWKKGGNIRGNEQFEKLYPIAKRQNKNAINKEEENAIKLRESWIPRHYEDYLINGVIAQIKWLAIGSKGEQYMKNLIDTEKEKTNKKKTNSEIKEVNQEVFKSLSMNQLSQTIKCMLDNYTYEDNTGWSSYLYYIEDITDNMIIVHNCQDNKEYCIPYSVDDDKKVSLDLENIKKQELNYIPKTKFEKIKFISKDKIGTGEDIEIDKSKESLSDDSWGDVDKSQLKKDCFIAGNWKTVCKAVFAQLLKGWEDGKEGSLKYPIMQKKGNKVVYNKGALASALTYAKANNENQLVSELMQIREHLDLDDDNKNIKEENNKNMESYIEQAKKSGYAFVGIESGNYIFAKEIECDDKENLCDDKKMSLFEISKEEANKKDKEFKSDELKEKSLKMEDNKDDKKEEDEEDYKIKCEELQKQYDEAMCNNEKLKKDCDDTKEKCEKAEQNYNTLKSENFNKEVKEVFDKNLDLANEDIEELNNMVKENKFNYNIEDLKKEIAYKQFQKKEKENKTQSLSFGLNNRINGNVEGNDLDTLYKNLGGK